MQKEKTKAKTVFKKQKQGFCIEDYIENSAKKSGETVAGHKGSNFDKKINKVAAKPVRQSGKVTVKPVRQSGKKTKGFDRHKKLEKCRLAGKFFKSRS